MFCSKHEFWGGEYWEIVDGGMVLGDGNNYQLGQTFNVKKGDIVRCLCAGSTYADSFLGSVLVSGTCSYYYIDHRQQIEASSGSPTLVAGIDIHGDYFFDGSYDNRKGKPARDYFISKDGSFYIRSKCSTNYRCFPVVVLRKTKNLKTYNMSPRSFGVNTTRYISNGHIKIFYIPVYSSYTYSATLNGNTFAIAFGGITLNDIMSPFTIIGGSQGNNGMLRPLILRSGDNLKNTGNDTYIYETDYIPIS